MKGNANPSPGAAPRPARVIRATDAAKADVQPLFPATRLLKGAVIEAEHAAAQAQRALEKARAEASATRQAAIDDAQAVRKEAFERGSEHAAEELGRTLRNFEAELDRLKRQFATDAQRIAFKLARMVLDVEFQVRPERIVELVSGVLGRAKLYNSVAVHLHPDDIQRVRPHEPDLMKQLAFARKIQWCADAELPLHGVRIETEMGIYDGSIDVQLKRLQAHLLGGTRQPSPEEEPDTGSAP